MTNQTLFADFVSSGWISGGNAPSISQDTTTLLWGFRNFIITNAMAANNYHLDVSSVGDPDYQYADDCSPGASETTSGCWWDATRFLILQIADRGQKVKPTQLLDDIVTKGWGHVQDILEGSLICLLANYTAPSPSLIRINSDGSLNTNCLNQVQVLPGEEGVIAKFASSP